MWHYNIADCNFQTMPANKTDFFPSSYSIVWIYQIEGNIEYDKIWAVFYMQNGFLKSILAVDGYFILTISKIWLLSHFEKKIFQIYKVCNWSEIMFLTLFRNVNQGLVKNLLIVYILWKSRFIKSIRCWSVFSIWCLSPCGSCWAVILHKMECCHE